MLLRAGNRAEGERLAAQAARGIQQFRQRTLEEIQERAGGKAKAEQVFRDLLAKRRKGTDINVLSTLAEMREEAGDEGEAESFAYQAAREGSALGWVNIAITRANRDDMRGAERAARIASDNGDSWALLEFARELAESDSRWSRILHFGLEADGGTSEPWEMERSFIK